jgi:hypothetical protein
MLMASYAATGAGARFLHVRIWRRGCVRLHRRGYRLYPGLLPNRLSRRRQCNALGRDRRGQLDQRRKISPASTPSRGCTTTASPTSATWGIDYSQQNSAQITFTDMVIDGTINKKFTSDLRSSRRRHPTLGPLSARRSAQKARSPSPKWSLAVARWRGNQMSYLGLQPHGVVRHGMGFGTVTAVRGEKQKYCVRIRPVGGLRSPRKSLRIMVGAQRLEPRASCV